MIITINKIKMLIPPWSANFIFLMIFFNTFNTYQFITRAKMLRKTYNINKLKIRALTWIDKFELLDYSNSVSDMLDHMDHSMKNTRNISKK